MTRVRRALVLVAALFLLAACQSASPVASPTADSATVTGNVTYAEGVTLPAGATITVGLIDLTEGANTVLGTQEISPDGNTSPIPFEIGYSKADINQEHEYAVEAAVTDSSGAKIFESDSTVPVITNNNPVQAVDVPVVAVAAAQPSADTASGLVGKSWELLTLGENPPLPNTNPGIVFTADGNVSGFDGCNTLVATYTTSGSSLTITPGATTMMACAEDVSQQATAFLNALTATASYTIVGEELNLIDADGKVVAVFQATAQELANTAWNVETFNNGKSALVTPATPGINLNFAADGTVSGFSGCNTFTGPYVTDGDKITLGPLATTRKACAEPANAMEEETQYLNALQSATNFQVQGTALTLQLSTGEMAAMFGAAE